MSQLTITKGNWNDREIRNAVPWMDGYIQAMEDYGLDHRFEDEDFVGEMLIHYNSLSAEPGADFIVGIVEEVPERSEKKTVFEKMADELSTGEMDTEEEEMKIQWHRKERVVVADWHLGKCLCCGVSTVREGGADFECDYCRVVSLQYKKKHEDFKKVMEQLKTQHEEKVEWNEDIKNTCVCAWRDTPNPTCWCWRAREEKIKEEEEIIKKAKETADEFMKRPDMIELVREMNEYCDEVERKYKK